MDLKGSRQARPQQHKDGGFVLVISLVFLLLMTIIGVSTMQSTTLSEKMAGNLRDQQLAFDAAEAALRAAENWLAGIPSEEIPDVCTDLASDLSDSEAEKCQNWTDNLVYPDNLSSLVNLKLSQQSAAWWSENAKPISDANHTVASGVLAGKPYVLIEQLGTGATNNVAGARTETSGPQGGNTNLGPSVRYYRITTYAVGGTDTAVAVLQSTFAKRVTGGS